MKRLVAIATKTPIARRPTILCVPFLTKVLQRIRLRIEENRRDQVGYSRGIAAVRRFCEPSTIPRTVSRPIRDRDQRPRIIVAVSSRLQYLEFFGIDVEFQRSPIRKN